MLGCLAPVLDRLRPLAPDSRKGEEYKLFEGGVVREDPLVFGPFSALFSRFSNNGSSIPSFPDNGIPDFNCSMACALNCS